MSNFNISTHTSLAERDAVPSGSARISSGFLLTHPLWDVTWSWLSAYPEIYPFLLTCPLRDVTDPGPADPLPFPHFYSPPLAGRDDILVEVYECFEISTHTPLTERDSILCILGVCADISTHTPLAGRDRYI